LGRCFQYVADWFMVCLQKAISFVALKKQGKLHLIKEIIKSNLSLHSLVKFSNEIKSREGKARQGKARQGKARQGKGE